MAAAYVWCGERLCQARNSGRSVARAYYAEGEYVPGASPQAYYYGPDRIGSVGRVFTSGSDYFQIFLQDRSILNLFNKYEMVECNEMSLPGTTIVDVAYDKENFNIIFSPRGEIRVSLADKDFGDPEAIEYVSATGRTVVWQ